MSAMSPRALGLFTSLTETSRAASALTLYMLVLLACESVQVQSQAKQSERSARPNVYKGF